jgi:fatty-acid peroxygenase
MRSIPKDVRFDVTLAMLRDPYHFVAKRCRSLNAEVFSSRLMLRKTIFMSGPAAAELFYTPDRFIRRKAPPHRLKQTLFGNGTVQNLDNDPHRHRKQMFVSLLNGPGVERLSNQVRQEWEKAVPGWQKQNTVQLYPAIQEVLMRAVCAWAGVPLAPSEVGKRTRQVVALFDGAGAVGPRHWWSRLSRKLAESWLTGLIDDVRHDRMPAAKDGALRTVALQNGATGQRMAARVAAAELLNILRPTVAISVYITFIAPPCNGTPKRWPACAMGTLRICRCSSTRCAAGIRSFHP